MFHQVAKIYLDSKQFYFPLWLVTKNLKIILVDDHQSDYIAKFKKLKKKKKTYKETGLFSSYLWCC
jgi:hypothetical protein